MSRRAIAPVIGITLLVAVTVVLAAVVGAFAIGVSGGQTDDVPQAAIIARSGSNPNEIFLTHQGGDVLNVSELTMRIFIDGQPLEHQPDIPFFGEKGFVNGTKGPIRPTSDNLWSTGEVARFEIAHTTNSPQPTDGSQVTVKIYSDGKAVTTARV